ncbi:MAG: hypothetical protein ABFD50_19320, partial [Smithella sp.]
MVVKLLKTWMGQSIGDEVNVPAPVGEYMIAQGNATIVDINEYPVIKKVSAELTRPATTTTYDAGDAILGKVTAVKQKETLTLSGTFGEAEITGAGGLTKTITFETGLTETAAAFVTDNADAYLAVGITLTSNGADLVFESTTVGVPIIPPVITNPTSDMAGTVTHTTANRAAVKQKETITLAGEYGSCVISAAGALSKTVTFDTDLGTTAANFVTANAAEYLTKGIVLTASTVDLIFEANVAGVSFVAPLISGVVGDLAGIVTHTTANRVAVKQKDTLTLTGASGTALLTGITTNPKIITFSVSPSQTATNFTAANVAEYLTHGIVLTSDGADLIFEANVAGVEFTHPVLSFTASTLDGTVVNTTVAGEAAKQKDTLTLSGTAGHAHISAVGGLTVPIDFSNNLTETAANFVTENAASYLSEGIVISSSAEDLIFEASEVNTPFASPVITNVINIQGTWVATTANVTAVAQVETIAVAGVSGYAVIAVAGGLTKYLAYATSTAASIDAFITANAALYLAQGIVLSRESANLKMTASVAGTGFTAPTITNVPGVRGTVAHTTANVTAVKQVETIVIAGTFGQATIAAAGGLSKVATFDISLINTLENFVIANLALYDAQGIVITSSGNQLNFYAKVAGTGFTAPTITVKANLSGTVVATTANVSLSALQFVGAGKQKGVGGKLLMIKAATNMVMFAGKTIRLWMFDSEPTLIVGDNIAYVSKYENAGVNDFYVDIVFDTLLANSDMVYGKATPNCPFSTDDKVLYCLIQS